MAVERVAYEDAVGRKLASGDREITGVVPLRLTPGWTAFMLDRFGVTVLPTSPDRLVTVTV